MKHMAIIGAGLMFASNATNAQQTDTRNEAILGVWSNPSGSVHVRIKECGTKLCGVVVYATEKAKSDAAQAGTAVLIGINLFREFDRYDRNKWRGKVLVPDLDRTVSGELKPISGNTLQVHGCMFGHVACKNQKWTRVSK
tara:strand:- start:4318 stop:4737 length:420 start_codon:yes stop_codon:yes gene_type:complete